METNGVTWTSEDVKLVEKFIEIKNKGYYVSGEQLTSAYNRILNKNVAVTNCGSCLRSRIQELEKALQGFKKQLELESKEDENNAVTEAGNDDMKARMAKVRAARKLKK